MRFVLFTVSMVIGRMFTKHLLGGDEFADVDRVQRLNRRAERRIRRYHRQNPDDNRFWFDW